MSPLCATISQHPGHPELRGQRYRSHPAARANAYYFRAYERIRLLGLGQLKIDSIFLNKDRFDSSY